jgi:hypothetical protein
MKIIRILLEPHAFTRTYIQYYRLHGGEVRQADGTSCLEYINISGKGLENQNKSQLSVQELKVIVRLK